MCVTQRPLSQKTWTADLSLCNEKPFSISTSFFDIHLSWTVNDIEPHTFLTMTFTAPPPPSLILQLILCLRDLLSFSSRLIPLSMESFDTILWCSIGWSSTSRSALFFALHVSDDDCLRRAFYTSLRDTSFKTSSSLPLSKPRGLLCIFKVYLGLLWKHSMLRRK